MRQREVDFESVDYAKQGLDEATVLSLVAKAGSVATVLNTRHETAKAKGWGDKPPDARTFAKAVVKEPNLLKRPLLVVGSKVIVGFDEAAYKKL
ncbi:MAG: arsenate reductase family protein [Acidobacteriota bacterium]